MDPWDCHTVARLAYFTVSLTHMHLLSDCGVDRVPEGMAPKCVSRRRGFEGSMGSWVGAVVTVAMVAAVVVGWASPVYGQPEQCNLKSLMPCLKSVRGPYPPQPDPSCCGVVMVYNPACMCSEFVDSKDYPQSYIKNVLAIPKACGRYQLSGYRCGIYTIE